MSFVVVRFSDEYDHNIVRSSCVADPMNELITVDNRGNLRFDNLSQAINSGLERAIHDLVAVVHEDVLLPDGWQQRLETSLATLERHDPDWGMLGAAGWTRPQGLRRKRRLVGHWSDPYRYRNTLGRRAFLEVQRVDEQLMIIRRSSAVRFDDLLPGIHHIGRDVASTLEACGRRTYVVDAPTIHKYADGEGRPIAKPTESPKIVSRTLPAYVADRQCATEYLDRKWPAWRPDRDDVDQPATDVGSAIERTPPVVLLARGGSGSRLLSTLAIDAGIHLGNHLNNSGDSMEMVQDVYMAVLNTHLDRATWQRDGVVPALRAAAARMLGGRSDVDGPWGFKLPESMLVLPEIAAAFPHARYIHLLRDPLATCFRRTHMTARFDNPIGRVAIRAAYEHCGREPLSSLDDSPGLHMAYTTVHQIEIVRDFAHRELAERYVEIRFEELVADPTGTLASVCDWLGTTPSRTRIEHEVDPDRAAPIGVPSPYPPDVEAAVHRALCDLRRELAYA